MHPTIVMLMTLDNSKSQRDSFHRHNEITLKLRYKQRIFTYCLNSIHVRQRYIKDRFI